MRGLDTHHHILISTRHFSDTFGQHVGDVLLHDVGHHSVAGDVDHREDASLGAVDDGGAKLVEVTITRAACINHGGNSATEAKRIRVDAVVTGPSGRNIGGVENVNVQIDDARGDVQTGRVDNF